MNVAVSVFESLRALYASEDRMLIESVLNDVSTAEASMSMALLAERVPHRVLVGALNLRETLHELPSAPFPMMMDFEQLARVSGLARRGSSWILNASGADGHFEIELIGQGNMCFDTVVGSDGERSLFKPGPLHEHLVKPKALQVVMTTEGLLRTMVELVQDMGMVYNPHFYLAMEDWQLEHAVDSLDGLNELF